MQETKIIVFGGTGFVGTSVAKNLVSRGINTVCVSRSGSRPAHLATNAPWAEQVQWETGDATSPDHTLLKSATVVLTLVGSPPLPTFTKRAWQQQLLMNSEPSIQVINAAQQCGVPRVVLLGAHLPWLLQTDFFAYAKGKRLSFEAAQNFANAAQKHVATVIQPSAIYGTRHTRSGKAINIARVMRPLAKLQNALPAMINKVLPEPFVSVDAVAQCTVDACLADQYPSKFSVIANAQIAGAKG
jgi:nucleoside-diphosphate-sugar epimerase